MPPPRRLTLALIFALAMLPDLLFSQFFTAYQPNQIQWPSGGLARYQALQDPSLSKSVQIVSTLDVRNAQSNGFLAFQLPGSTDVLQAEASIITDDPTTGFIWSEKLTNAPGGYVTFIYRDGKTAGFIQVGKDFYEISPINNSFQFLVKRNNDYAASGVCGASSSPQEPPPPGPDACDYEPDYNTCPALITVLLILTPEAKLMVENMYGSVDLFALLGQSSVNSAFWNSDIPNKEIRVKWVVKSGFPFSDPNSIKLDNEALPAFSEPERSDNNADLVVFVPHVTYDHGAGYANLPDVPDPTQAFSIVLPKYFLSLFVFAHELGHTFGCHHNWYFDIGDDDAKICAHGKRSLPINTINPPYLQEIDSWRTVMGDPLPFPSGTVYVYEIGGIEYLIQIDSDYPILHYSNPSVTYSGEATGRAEGKIADNADHIRKVGCDIDGYDGANELAVNISTSPCSIPITLTANITQPDPGLPGVAPYTVYWFWNTSGIFGTGTPPQVLGIGATLNLTGHPACPVFWVKCVVVSSDNVVISRIQKVTINPCQCLMEERPGRSTDTDLIQLPTHSSSLFPNPVSQGILFVQNEKLQTGDAVTYRIVDVWGRTVLSGDSKRLDENQLGLPVEGLVDGFYFLNLLLPNSTQEIHKFIIAKAQ